MKGTNERLGPDMGDGTSLVVRETFWTIQGEGPHAGRSALFIRLAGCHLACDFCDTDFDLAKSRCMTLDGLFKVCADDRNASLVVLTGGEPMRQNLGPLVHLLLALPAAEVQVETAGTFFQEGLPYDSPRFSVVCSPKTASVHSRLAPNVAAWKYIIGTATILRPNGLPAGLWSPTPLLDAAPIYYQPMDEGDPELNAANVRRCAELTMQYDRRLSLQLHKILGLP